MVIIDNSPASYAFHPENAVPVQSWFDDANDTELIEIIPFLEKLAKVDNVYPLLRTYHGSSRSGQNQSIMMNNDNGNFVVDRLHPQHMR